MVLVPIFEENRWTDLMLLFPGFSRSGTFRIMVLAIMFAALPSGKNHFMQHNAHDKIMKPGDK